MDKKKFLEKELEKFSDIADTNPESDIPITEKKTKERLTKG